VEHTVIPGVYRWAQRAVGLAGLLLLFSSSVGAVGTAPEDIVGKIVGVIGTVEVLPKGEGGIWDALAKGDPVRLKDVVRTGNDGRARIEFADRDEAENAGPSVVNLGPGTEVSMDSFEVRFDTPRESQGLLSLIRGTVRAFARGWGSNSLFDVKAGVALCGIRGSEQIIRHDPTGGDEGLGKTWQSSLSGEVVTRSTDPTSYPGERPLTNMMQRFMRSRDPATWIDIPLTTRRRDQLIGQTEMPGNEGRSEEEHFEERFGEGGSGDGARRGDAGDLDEAELRRLLRGVVPGSLAPRSRFAGVQWGADELPDCAAEVEGILLNDYAWDDLDDYRNFTFYRDELVNGRFVVSGDVRTTCPPHLVEVEVSLDGGRTWARARFSQETRTFRYAFDPTGWTNLDFRVRAVFDDEVVRAYHIGRGLVEE